MILTQLDDHMLVKSYLKGNEEALQVLIRRHKSKVFSYIRFTVKEKELAEDFFQDTFIKVINTLKQGRYDEKGKFLPWVMRIAHNLVIDFFRKNNRVKLVRENPGQNEDFNIFSILSNGDDNVLQDMSKSELLEQMVELVEYLPDTQREIIQLRIFNDMSFKDIAELEDISINTALGRMRYALLNLRKMIEKHNLVLDVY